MITWQTEPLGTLVEMVTEKVNVTDLTVDNYISTENMLPHRGGVTTASKLPAKGNVNSFRPGDILFSNIRTYFKKVWSAQFHGGASADIIIFRPKDKRRIDSKFLYYVLSSDAFIDSTVTASKGTKMPRGDKDAMRHYMISLPSIHTQRKIAAVLTVYDDLIENNTRRIAILEEMSRIVFREWFVNFRFPSNEIVKFVDSPIGQIPEGWGVSPLEEIVSAIIDYRGKTPKKLGSDWSESGIMALSAKIVKGGSLRNLDQVRFVDEDLYRRWMKEEIQRGDVIMTSEAPMGELYFVADDTRYCLSQRVFALRSKKGRSTPAYLYHLMQSEPMQSRISGRGTGSTVKGIRQSLLRSLPTLVAPPTLLDMFESCVRPMRDLVDNFHKKSRKLIETRDFLRRDLISGELIVENLDIESSEAGGIIEEVSV